MYVKVREAIGVMAKIMHRRKIAGIGLAPAWNFAGDRCNRAVEAEGVGGAYASRITAEHLGKHGNFPRKCPILRDINANRVAKAPPGALG